MSEHKHNPTSIAAKRGELPPKPKKMSKAQRDRLLMEEIERKTGISHIVRMLGR